MKSQTRFLLSGAKKMTIVLLLFVLNFQGSGQSPNSISLKLRDSIIIECKRIEAGTFIMGSSDEDTLAGAPEKPRRTIEIKEPFYLGLTTVTLQQFRVFIEETGYKTVAESDGIGGHGYNKEKYKFEGLFPQYTWKHTGWVQTPYHPVVNISWIDATKFCEWLSKKTGRTVRLPEEEEWEYACRAGTTSLFYTGDDPLSLKGYANVADDALREKADTNSINKSNRPFPFNDGFPFTSPVRSFKPNPWGLYDMIGNVYQICNGVFSLTEGARQYNNVVRGGSYNSGPEFLRCAFRGSVKSSSKYSYTGFRIAVTP
ncbi:MAG TPA: formylglycine-generating enzyme family protein [Flavitalea sp.]|nr:formylglycine-generating enzyme family protein [Flavitalea sp.]